MTRKTARIDENIHLSYLDLGPADGQPLLLIHGFTGTARGDLGEVIDVFAHDHHVIAPDLRGFGASRPPNRDFPPDFYERDAADLAALLDALALGPVTVLGFSDGAEAAILLAAARPDQVRGVVAWGVCGVISPEELAAVEGWLPVAAWGPERDTWKQQIIERHGAEQLASMIEGWVGAARAISARGGNIGYEQAARIKCPVLLLNGDGEVGNTPRDVRRLAERIPNARLEFIADSGHAIHRDQPAALLGYIRDFLAEVEKAA
jgi:valacyclovir hydrolase